MYTILYNDIIEFLDRGFVVWAQCVHFSVKHQHTAFSNSTEVLDVAVVTDIASCARHCNKFSDCFAFTVQSVPEGIMCHIGTDQANLTAREGSVFYEHVLN